MNAGVLRSGLRAFAALRRARDARGDKGGEAGLRDVGTCAAASGEFVEVYNGVAARTALTVLIELPASDLLGRVGVNNTHSEKRTGTSRTSTGL
jgi:hypothetical protein